MREIKFRAWNKVTNKMEQWDASYFGDIVFGSGNDYIAMQYTGLKDKNGVEVYEGDIIDCSAGCLHEIYWDEGYLPGWNLDKLKSRGLMMYDWIGCEEVVGNIYEDKELLDE